MAFPDEPLPLIVEAVFGGVTVDLSDRLDVLGSEQSVTITRGKASGARQVSTGSCRLILDDSDGALTPLNPTGDHYPYVRRGAEFRVRLPEAPGDGGSGGASASNVAPSLDVVDGPALLACMWLAGDEGVPTDYNFTVPGSMVEGPEADDGDFSSSTTATETVAAGLTGTRTATSSPTPDNWMALSVAVPGDVTVQERLSDAALGADVILTTAAGTRAGWWLLAFQGWDFAEDWPPPPSGDGWMQLAEVDGIGRMRAWLKPIYEAGAQAVTFSEGPSVVDNHCHLLVLSGARAMVLPTADARRITGFASAYRPKLIPTTDGMRAVQQIDVAGPLRRLEKGQPPLASPIRRQSLSAQNSAALQAYWPCEDGSEATRIAAGMPGVQPMRVVGAAVSFANDDTSFPGSAPLLTLGATMLAANIPPHTGTGTIAYRALFTFPPGGLPDNCVIFDLWQAVTAVRRWRITYHTGGGLQVWAIGSGGTVIDQSGVIAFAVDGRNAMLGLAVVQDGSDTDWHIFTRHIDGSAVVQGGLDGTFPGLTVDRSAELYIAPGMDMSGVTTGHHLVGTDINLASDITSALTGFTHEKAVFRFLRLAETENGLPADYVGASASESAYLGPQRVDTLPNLLHETAFADGGILGEARASTELTIRDRTDMYNQTPALVIDLATYRTAAGTSGNVLAPVYDETSLINRFVAERPRGSSAVAQDTASIAADGVLDDSGEYNVETDEQIADVAAWEVRLGVVDEYRNPALALDLAANPELIPQWAAAELGDRIQRLNPPAPHPPGTIDQLLDGYQETLGPKRWEVSANTQPAGPWAVAEVHDEDATHGYDPRVAGDMVLTSAVGSAVTRLLSQSISGEQRWCTTTDDAESADDFPFDVNVFGERVTVTAVDRALVDTMTRTVGAGGWGTASDGINAWTVGLGTTTDFSVNGSQGLVDLTAINAERHITTDIGGSFNQNVRLWCTVPVTPTGAGVNWGILLRYTDSLNYYWADVQVGTDSSLTLRFIKRVAGVATQIATAVSPFTHSTSVPRALRAQLVGSAFRSRVWPSDQVEPQYWQLVSSDSAISGTTLTRAGAISRLMTGNTNVGGAQFRFDNVVADSPQALTVTRGVNGISKSLPAGAVMEVFEPAYVAR